MKPADDVVAYAAHRRAGEHDMVRSSPISCTPFGSILAIPGSETPMGRGASGATSSAHRSPRGA